MEEVRVAKVVTQAVFTLSGTLAQGLARIAIPILVGRFADPTSLAHVSLALSVCVLLSMVWPTPAGTAASRYVVDDSVRSRRALQTLRVSTAFALAVVAIASFFIVLGLTASAGLALLSALVTVTYSAYFFTRGVFLGRFRARRLATWEIIGAVVAVVGALLSLLAGVWIGALVALAVGYLLIAVVGWPWSRSDGQAIDRTVLSFTAHNAVANAASNGMVQLAMVVAFALSGSIEAALFAAAFSLATPASLFGQAINQVLIPHLADEVQSKEPDRRALTTAGLKLVGLTLVPFAAVFFLSPIVLPIVYGDRYDGAVPMLQTLVVAMFFFTVALYPAAALTAWGRARELVIANVTGLVVGVVAMIALGIANGAMGTAFGLVIGTVVLAAMAIGAMFLALRRGVRPTESE